MRRQLYAGGGVTRQHYGLGSLVRKAIKAVTRPVKQIMKSPIGKAALLGATMYGLGGGTYLGRGLPGLARGAGGTTGFQMGNIMPNIMNYMVGQKSIPNIGGAEATKGLLGAGGKFSLGKTAAAGAMALAAIPSPMGTEGFNMAQRKGEVEQYLRRYYKAYYENSSERAWNQDEEDDFVTKYTSEYNQGGRVGLQEGGLPAVDPRMDRTLEENVRMNNLQKEMNERIKQGSSTGGLELRNRFVNRVAEGPTGAQMYGINPQAYNMNTPTTPVNEASMYASYRNQGLDPNQIKAIAYHDAMESRGTGPNLSPIPMPGDPLFMENIFSSEPEFDAHYQEGLRRSMLEGSPEIYWDQGSKAYKLHDSEYLRDLYNQPSQFEQLSGYKTEKEAIDAMGIERYNQLMSKGGRVGLYGGGRLDAGAQSIVKTGNMETEDSDEAQAILMARYNPGSVFSSSEITRLYRDPSLTTNMDRKQLHKILKNPGMFPDAENDLKILLRRNRATGGRVGLYAGGDPEDYLEEEDDVTPWELQQEEGVPIGPMAKGYKLIDFALDEDILRMSGLKRYYLKDDPEAGHFSGEEVKEMIFDYAQGGRVESNIGGIMGGRVGLKVLKDYFEEEEEEYAQGGRIGAFGGGVMGVGTPGMRLPGIPQMAPDGLEYNMKAGGFQNLGAQEGKDDVNAKLAKNEFVMTADAVRGAGDGNIEVGAQKMYDTMKRLEGKVA